MKKSFYFYIVIMTTYVAYAMESDRSINTGYTMEKQPIKRLKFIELEILRYTIKINGNAVANKISRGEPFTAVLQLRPLKGPDSISKILREAIDLKEKRIATSFEIYQLLLTLNSNADFYLPPNLAKVITINVENTTYRLPYTRLGDYTEYTYEKDTRGDFIKCTTVFTDTELLEAEFNGILEAENKYSNLLDQIIAEEIKRLKLT